MRKVEEENGGKRKRKKMRWWQVVRGMGGERMSGWDGWGVGRERREKMEKK